MRIGSSLLAHQAGWSNEQAVCKSLARGWTGFESSWVAADTAQSSGRRQPKTDAETRALERQISGHLGLKVAIRHGVRGGQAVLSYKDLDQLDGIVRLLTQSA
jgi:ParB family chromosome partitioning protein